MSEAFTMTDSKLSALAQPPAGLHADLEAVRAQLGAQLAAIHVLRGEQAELVRRLESQRRGMLLECLAVADGLEARLDDSRRRTSELNERGLRMLQGFEAVGRKLEKMLARQGLERIDSTGLADPSVHFVSDVVTRDDVPEGTIVEVLLHGYRLGGTLLRQPEVRTAVRSSEQADETGSDS